MTNLYAMTNEFEQYLNTTEELDIDTFLAMEGKINDKMTSLIAVIRNYQSLSDATGEEIKRLQARKKTSDNKVKSLKQYLQDSMKKAQMTTVESPLGKAFFTSRTKYENNDKNVLKYTAKVSKELGSNDIKAMFDGEKSTKWFIEQFIIDGDEIYLPLENGGRTLVASREKTQSLTLK